MSEIASAFVRIRPNMASFKSETEMGVTKGMAGVGKLIAGSFAGIASYDFVKGSIQQAAALQKSTEAVKEQFGEASAAVIDFGENAATKLGISNSVAESAAAKFGILFHNMGIAKTTGAEMTVGIEKLVGSLSQVRNMDPGTIMERMNLALAGNTRGLKQLGIAIDPTMMKQEAFKLGLIGSVKDALTPAIKAQAIYALSTKDLGYWQDQAKKHSGDLANQQRVLSAEWKNAEEKVGQGLLPILTKVAGVLARDLPEAVRITSEIFKAFFDTIGTLFAPVYTKLVKPLVDEFVKIRDIISGGGGLRGAFDKLKEDFTSMSAPAKIAAVAIAAIGVALLAATAAAAPITFTVIAIVGLTEGFKALYTHSARFRQVIGDVQEFLGTKVMPVVQRVSQVIVDGFGKAIKYVQANMPAIERVMTRVGRTIIEAIGGAVKFVQSILPGLTKIFHEVVTVITVLWNRFGGTILSVVRTTFETMWGVVQGATKVIANIIRAFIALFTGDWSGLWKSVKGIASGALDVVKALLAGAAKTFLALAKAAGKALLDGFAWAFNEIKKGITLVVQTILDKVAAVLLKIPTKILGIHIPGMSELHNWAESLKSWQDGGAALGSAAAAAAQTALGSVSIGGPSGIAGFTVGGGIGGGGVGSGGTGGSGAQIKAPVVPSGTSNRAGRQKLLDLASSMIGNPYVWGGTGPGGFDCSGLVAWALGNGLNMNIGRTTTAMIGKGAMESKAAAKPGDLVFTNFRGGQPQHMGIYAGGDRVIASEGAGPSATAAHPGPGVMNIPLSQFTVGATTVFQSLIPLVKAAGSVITQKAAEAKAAAVTKADAAAKAAGARKAAADANALVFHPDIAGTGTAGLPSAAAGKAAEKAAAAKQALENTRATLKQAFDLIKTNAAALGPGATAAIKAEIAKMSKALAGFSSKEGAVKARLELSKLRADVSAELTRVKAAIAQSTIFNGLVAQVKKLGSDVTPDIKAKMAALHAEITRGTAAAGKMFVLPGSPTGLLAPGNLDLLHRKIATIGKDTIATVKSFSVSVDGTQVLLPSVIDGKIVSLKAAIQHFQKTGENLGKFDSVSAANAYAEQLHQQQAKYYATGAGSDLFGKAQLKAQTTALRVEIKDQLTRIKTEIALTSIFNGLKAQAAKLGTDITPDIRAKMRALGIAITNVVTPEGKARVVTQMAAVRGEIRDQAARIRTEAALTGTFDGLVKQAATLGSNVTPQIKAMMTTLRGELHNVSTPADKARVKSDLADLHAAIKAELTRISSEASLSAPFKGLKDEMLKLGSDVTPGLKAQMEVIRNEIGKVSTPAQAARVRAQMDVIKTEVSNSLSLIQASISAAKTNFDSAWRQLASGADTAFDQETQKILKNMQVMVQMVNGLSFAFGGGITQTPSEVILQQMQDAKTAADQADALSQAQTALAADQATNLSAIADARAAYNAAQSQVDAARAAAKPDPSAIKLAQDALGNAAAALRDASDPTKNATQIAADQKTVANAEYDIRVTALQKAANAERSAATEQLQDAQTAYQNQRGLLRAQMDERLAIIEQGMLNGTLAARDGMDQLTGVLADPAYGIDMENSGLVIGTSLYTGLKTGLDPVFGLLKSLTDLMTGAGLLGGDSTLTTAANIALATDPNAALLAAINRSNATQGEIRDEIKRGNGIAVKPKAAPAVTVHVNTGPNANQVARDALR